MHLDVFVCVSGGFVSLVWPPKAAAGGFFLLKKDVPSFFEHVNSEKCTKCVVSLVFYTSDEKMQIWPLQLK